jgi:hypothetical protein
MRIFLTFHRLNCAIKILTDIKPKNKFQIKLDMHC